MKWERREQDDWFADTPIGRFYIVNQKWFVEAPYKVISVTFDNDYATLDEAKAAVNDHLSKVAAKLSKGIQDE